ncbi:MAG: spermidine synthase [Devosia sp.]|uniref:spermidine synthase n=1 Tax=Devosia sp. TaxID=1871048 RepID=UPI00261A57E1|nr:spermidine synthase [Devosia sp.]MDB5542370.1 spermidine synthase [Devosia sp.]
MLPWIELDRAMMPGGGELRLMQRGAEFTIFSGMIGLMSSRMSGSEEVMAELAAERIGMRPRARVLIGGLGMGFTLRAALASFRPDAELKVAELVPAVIAWARGPLKTVHGESLDDPRVVLREGDVGRVMAADRQKFDAILLDVDNGPEGLGRPANDRLYDHGGLAAAKAALRPGGMLAVWSVAPDAKFTKRLQQTGMQVEEIRARAHGKRSGARHLIWVATKTAPRVASTKGATRGA